MGWAPGYVPRTMTVPEMLVTDDHGRRSGIKGEALRRHASPPRRLPGLLIRGRGRLHLAFLSEVRQLPSRIAPRIRWLRNQAVLKVTPSLRWSWRMLMPFWEELSRNKAASHLCSGTWLDANAGPLVTPNSFRQCPHLRVPGLAAAPLSSMIRSPAPQCGHTGPLGQRCASTNSRAACPSWSRGTFTTDMRAPYVGKDCIPNRLTNYEIMKKFQ